MANWDFVLPYDDRSASWLTGQNYPHPPVFSGNRVPSTADMKWALSQQEPLKLDYPEGENQFYVFKQEEEGFEICIRGFNWSDDIATPKNDCFSIRWMGELQATLLTSLTQRCGQLIMWPDTGSPAIIFQAGDDPKAINWLWDEAHKREDSWSFFFERMYS